MEELGGVAYLLEREDDKGIHRQACATFTTEELSNLERFGDFISIDPTFAPTSTDWSLIPLVVIGTRREIRSAGLIFCSNLKASTFRWILRLLLTVLPCQSKLQTICSDDDPGLGCAFNQILEGNEDQDLQPKTASINRVICYWHKLKNFEDFMKRAGLSKEKISELKEIFREMAFTRSKQHCRECLSRLKEVPEITGYITEHVEEKMKHFCKSLLGNAFTCGYITSSISESANNRLKSRMSGRAMSLADIRELQNEIEEQANTNTRYVKGRKHLRAVHPEIAELVTSLRITQPIAEAIAASLHKAKKLRTEHTGPKYMFFEQHVDAGGNVLREDKFEVIRTHCTCCKLEQTGIPCCHLLSKLTQTKTRIGEQHLHARWKLTEFEQQERLCTASIEATRFRYQEPQGAVITATPQGRFLFLTSHARHIVDVASKSQEHFELCVKSFEKLVEQMEDKSKEDTVVSEDHFSRPGRKRLHRTKSRGHV